MPPSLSLPLQLDSTQTFPALAVVFYPLYDQSLFCTHSTFAYTLDTHKDIHQVWKEA